MPASRATPPQPAGPVSPPDPGPRKSQTHREDGAQVVGVQREADDEERRPGVQPEARRYPDLALAVLVPDRTDVEKEPEPAVAIIDRRVDDAVAASGRDLVLVPAAERGRITEREALEERRVTGDRSRHAGRLDLVPAEIVSIRALPEVPRI